MNVLLNMSVFQHDFMIIDISIFLVKECLIFVNKNARF